MAGPCTFQNKVSKKSAITLTDMSVIVKDLMPNCHLSFDFYYMCCSRHGEKIHYVLIWCIFVRSYLLLFATYKNASAVLYRTCV